MQPAMQQASKPASQPASRPASRQSKEIGQQASKRTPTQASRQECSALQELPSQKLPSSTDAAWVSERPLLRLNDSSIKDHVASHSLQIAVRQLKPLLSCPVVWGPLVSHHLIVLISGGLLEHVVLWHCQRANLYQAVQKIGMVGSMGPWLQCLHKMSKSCMLTEAR